MKGIKTFKNKTLNEHIGIATPSPQRNNEMLAAKKERGGISTTYMCADIVENRIKQVPIN